MFIGKYELDGKEYNNIYYYGKNIYGNYNSGWDLWHEDTFSPFCKNIKLLDFRLHGKTYKERKNSLIELAKEWQYDFSSLSWSYGELAEICDWFYENGKRYGLLREFHENAIC